MRKYEVQSDGMCIDMFRPSYYSVLDNDSGVIIETAKNSKSIEEIVEKMVPVIMNDIDNKEERKKIESDIYDNAIEVLNMYYYEIIGHDEPIIK